ncbi:tetratricopeptide repeat protein [Streptomyces sp. NPDC048290]|uniref:tetratricopeptide repeat protein n=1 Tax=Streptomyces sp. NPDC048290 TaxID=3155811 RepID=UPI00343EF3BE
MPATPPATPPTTGHQWIRAAHRHDRRRLLTERAAGVPVLASVDAHRRLRGPYSGGGAVLRAIVPEALRRAPALVAGHETEILTLAPELRDLVPATRETLTSLAVPRERTRFYSRLRTWRIAHGVAEFLREYVRVLADGPRCLLVDNLHEADPTDQELFAVLLRRTDPAMLRLCLATGTGVPDPPPGPVPEPLDTALLRYAGEVTAEATALPDLPAGDQAARFVAGDCTDDDPRLREAYVLLPPARRAALHDARADALAAAGEPSTLLGAVAYHREHGSDPMGAGVGALRAALDTCVDLGLYHATVEWGRRGRALVGPETEREQWWAFTTKMTTSLAALGRAEEALALYTEVRTLTSSPALLMQAAYATAMILTRHLPGEAQDHAEARRWANTAIAFAHWIPDPAERAFQAAFHRNGLALVAVHERRLDEALRLVDEGLAQLERTLEPSAHALHRSVLRHNRSQVYAATGRLEEALIDLDAVIAADPNHPEYHFDRGGLLRRMGRPDAAIEAYEQAMWLSPPFPEVVYNRADARLEQGDTAGALADFGYVIDLDPGCVDAYANRAALRFAAGDDAGARADVDAGLALDPDSPPLRCLRGQLTAADDPDAAYALLSELVTARPAYAPGWAARGTTAYDRGEPGAAVADFDRALALSDDPEVRFNRGVARLATGAPEAALADLSTAFAAGGDPEAQFQLGICLLQLGRTRQAEAALTACVAADPALAPRVTALRHTPAPPA